METALALSRSWSELGTVCAAVLMVWAAATGVPKVRALTMLSVLALAPVLLLAEIWDSPQLEQVRNRPTVALIGACAALALTVAMAVAISRRPRLIVPLAAFTLPFRLPIDLGSQAVNLLVPLYLVIASGTLAYAVSALRGRSWEERFAQVDRKISRWLGAVLAVFVLAYVLQALYSSDFEVALEHTVFFYLPFGLLFALLTRLSWDVPLARQLLAVFAGLALLFVLIGYVEYSTRELLLNPKVINSNQFESYFRVNSLFFDPNIYGRFLACVMLMLTAALLWGANRLPAFSYVLLLAFLWGGLVLTFSQSSFGSLLVGLAVLGALRWRVRYALLAGAGVVAACATFVLLFPGAVKLDLESSKSIDKASSGRFQLIEGGLELFSNRPVYGYGSGSFAHEYRRQHKASSERAASASHTAPVTVAAEQGALGLVLFMGLLIGALVALLKGAGGSAARAAVGAAFAALVCHSLVYAAFLEDPLSWALMAAGVGLAGSGVGSRIGPEIGSPDGKTSRSGSRSSGGAADSSM